MQEVYYRAEINGKYEVGAPTIKELIRLLDAYVYYGAQCYIKKFDKDGEHNVIARHPNGFDTSLVISQNNYEYYKKYYNL